MHARAAAGPAAALTLAAALLGCAPTPAALDNQRDGTVTASVSDQHLDCAAFNLVAAAYLKSAGGPDREAQAKDVAALHYAQARTQTSLEEADTRIKVYADQYLTLLRSGNGAATETLVRKRDLCLGLFDSFRS